MFDAVVHRCLKGGALRKMYFCPFNIHCFICYLLLIQWIWKSFPKTQTTRLHLSQWKKIWLVSPSLVVAYLLWNHSDQAGLLGTKHHEYPSGFLGAWVGFDWILGLYLPINLQNQYVCISNHAFAFIDPLPLLFVTFSTSPKHEVMGASCVCRCQSGFVWIYLKDMRMPNIQSSAKDVAHSN